MANEIQKIEFSAEPIDGSFSITFDGQTTAEIDHPATAPAIQAALSNLSNVGSGNVIVTGDSSSGFQIEFVNDKGDQPLPEMTINANSMVGGVPVTVQFDTQTSGGVYSISALGTGTSPAWVRAAVVWNGELVLGGGFTTINGIAANRLAKFDGTTWTAIANPLPTTGTIVQSLEVYNGDLYVGGNFTFTSGGIQQRYVTRYDGTNWTRLGSAALTARAGQSAAGVYAMKVFNGFLYVGGKFGDSLGNLCIRRFNSADNSFNLVGDGLWKSAVSDFQAVTVDSQLVTCFEIFDYGTGPHLYVGGNFNGVSNDGITRIENTTCLARISTSNEWSAIGPLAYPEAGSWLMASVGSTGILDMAVLNNRLHLVGQLETNEPIDNYDFYSTLPGVAQRVNWLVWNPLYPTQDNYKTYPAEMNGEKFVLECGAPSGFMAANSVFQMYSAETISIPNELGNPVLRLFVSFLTSNPTQLNNSLVWTSGNQDFFSLVLSADPSTLPFVFYLKNVIFNGAPKMIVSGSFTFISNNDFNTGTLGPYIPANQLAQIATDAVTLRTMTFSDEPFSGQYKLGFDGQTTSAISFDATAENIENALEALSTIGSGNINVENI